MTSPKRLARIAGVFYLFVAIFGGFAEGIADKSLYVAGDAAATAGNVINAARWMVVLVALAAGITALNAVFQFEGLQVATNSSYAAAFGAAGSNALVLMLLDIQHYGTIAAQVSFGLWLAPLGYLVYKSGMFPKALGVVLVVAAVCYLVDVLVAFLVPDIAKQVSPLLVIGPIVAEIWLVGYLLVKNVRSPRVSDHGIVATVAPMPA